MRTKCRLCDSTDLELAVKVPPMPMIDGYTQAPNQFKAMPCDVYFCHSCGHAQLLDVLPPADIFTKYIFRTGDSPNLVSHFRAYADWLIANFDTSFVYEIGCNDGTLLEMMPNKKLGIDPSNIPCSAPSVRTFLTETTAKEIYKEHGPAPLIVANHVFAHADDLVDMLRGIRFLMTNRGKFIFEVAYAQDMLDKCLFDQIEHEHLSYHSIKPLIRFFSRYGMEITEIHRNDCKGGSVRCVAELSMEGYIPKFTED